MRFNGEVLAVLWLASGWVCAADLTIELPDGVSLDLLYTPPGTFLMGSPPDERGRTNNEDLHVVTLTTGYYLGRTEVTQMQWEAVTGTPMPASCGDAGVAPDVPVFCVTWNDIAGSGGYIEQLNAYVLASGQQGAGLFRLPTEAEWERAVRAGTQTRFSYGDVLGCDDICSYCVWHDTWMVYCANSVASADPVASRLANGFGFFDMQGNLFEAVHDWYDQHLGTTPVVDPVGPPGGQDRVRRGGEWFSTAKECRSASRRSWDLDLANDNTGFRLARSAPEVSLIDGFESGDASGWSFTTRKPDHP